MLGEFLKQKRTEMGLSQQELAFMLDTKYQHIQQWETGKKTPNLKYGILLSQYLNFDINNYMMYL